MIRRFLLPLCFFLCFAFSLASAETSLKAEFDETCSRTDEAMTLSVAELNQLIERCVRLRKSLEKEDETVRKVYLRRIEMCENLYRFVLETKTKQGKEEGAK